MARLQCPLCSFSLRGSSGNMSDRFILRLESQSRVFERERPISIIRSDGVGPSISPKRASAESVRLTIARWLRRAAGGSDPGHHKSPLCEANHFVMIEPADAIRALSGPAGADARGIRARTSAER